MKNRICWCAINALNCEFCYQLWTTITHSIHSHGHHLQWNFLGRIFWSHYSGAVRWWCILKVLVRLLSSNNQFTPILFGFRFLNYDFFSQSQLYANELIGPVFSVLKQTKFSSIHWNWIQNLKIGTWKIDERDRLNT